MKDVKFVQDNRCEAVFQELKQRLITILVRIVPNSNKPYMVYTYVLGTDLGYILIHIGKVVAYASCQLKPHKKTILPMTWNWL